VPASVRPSDPVADRRRKSSTELDLTMSKKPDHTMIRLLSEDFKRLADRSQDAIYQFDVESRTFSFFNKRFLVLYAVEDKSGKTLSPRSVLLHIHPDDREKVRAARTRSFQSKENTGEIEYRFLHNDGSLRFMHDRWTVVRDPQGRPTAIEGFIRDNTWLRQAEKDFELSMRATLIGCYIVQNARLQYVNPEFMRITGYREDELLGTSPLNLVQPDDRDRVKKNFIAMLKKERDYPYEFRIIDKHGNARWILETATSIRHKGRRAALGYFMDISKSKQMEQERLEKEKLLSILEMAGTVGHELNNPLQVMLTCTEKLAVPGDDAQRNTMLIDLLKKHLDKISVTIQKIQNITQYATKDYVQGKRIIDLDAAAASGD
jgi:PAS domain S-box-containing protein